MHSAVAQADGSRAAGHTVRREPVESIHPVVRVHPATGWKSIYVNPGMSARFISATAVHCSRRCIRFHAPHCGSAEGGERRGTPAAVPPDCVRISFPLASCASAADMSSHFSENVDFQVRFHWEPNSIAFWDNRVSDAAGHVPRPPSPAPALTCHVLRLRLGCDAQCHIRLLAAH